MTTIILICALPLATLLVVSIILIHLATHQSMEDIHGDSEAPDFEREELDWCNAICSSYEHSAQCSACPHYGGYECDQESISKV